MLPEEEPRDYLSVLGTRVAHAGRHATVDGISYRRQSGKRLYRLLFDGDDPLDFDYVTYDSIITNQL